MPGKRGLLGGLLGAVLRAAVSMEKQRNGTAPSSPPSSPLFPGTLPGTLPGTFGDLGFLSPVAGGRDSYIWAHFLASCPFLKIMELNFDYFSGRVKKAVAVAEEKKSRGVPEGGADFPAAIFQGRANREVQTVN